MKKLVLGSIRFYQNFLKEGILANIFIWGRCRFIPTCSEYTYLAIEKYGTIKGLILGFRRVLRCHPFTRGGFDPV